MIQEPYGTCKGVGATQQEERVINADTCEKQVFEPNLNYKSGKFKSIVIL